MSIKADANVFDFDKSEGSFTGRTTVDQLKEIQDRIVAALKEEDVHIPLISKLLGIEQKYEKRKHAAIDAASKKKAKK
jgi:hypothetical protein